MPPETPLSTERPLLTIAIPTFNRAVHLAELLAVLEPQLAAYPQVELLVSDNASEDTTPQILAAAQERFAAQGIPLVIHRHAVNVGADANFVSCYHRARGRFFWLCGDDDLIVPGGLAQVMPHLQDATGKPAEVDLLYATSYGFREDYQCERQTDPFGRRFHTIRSAKTFSMVVNIMFTFISGIIVNKERLESLPHEDPTALLGTNLVQLAWSLPLLLQHRRSIVLWERPVAARQGNANGYSLGRVFGEHLAGNLARLLPGRPDLSAPILNFMLRRWFPSILLDVRSAGNETLQLGEAHSALRQTFGNNPRYWLFTYPALAWPLPLARLYTRGTAALSKLIYMAHLPGFWRKQT
ncbi:glycosyltransferase [Granulicella sp. S156]|jgi:abequosyltransferase|uniref:glycosyltransferase family 2 protein n=1 Tax=Granulicella sp. S156 TaxID=1747224 RepID=UPI00131B26C7|nr:glycosyltransferase [Granulicella sp. S156]